MINNIMKRVIKYLNNNIGFLPGLVMITYISLTLIVLLAPLVFKIVSIGILAYLLSDY